LHEKEHQKTLDLRVRVVCPAMKYFTARGAGHQGREDGAEDGIGGLVADPLGKEGPSYSECERQQLLLTNV
jgi:hypothetical protein